MDPRFKSLPLLEEETLENIHELVKVKVTEIADAEVETVPSVQSEKPAAKKTKPASIFGDMLSASNRVFNKKH